MGPAARIRLEFALHMLPCAELCELMTHDCRRVVGRPALRRAYLKGCHAPLVVLGGGHAQWSCVSTLWTTNRVGGPARQVAEVHVMGTVDMATLDLRPHTVRL
jgi:hypothetical protein